MSFAEAAELAVVTAPQGVGSKTWTPPPFFGDLTIPELYAFHAEKSSQHPVIAFNEEDGSIRTLTFTDIFRGILKAANIVSRYAPSQLGTNTSGAGAGSNSERHVVGILAIAGASSPRYPRLVTLG